MPSPAVMSSLRGAAASAVATYGIRPAAPASAPATGRFDPGPATIVSISAAARARVPSLGALPPPPRVDPPQLLLPSALETARTPSRLGAEMRKQGASLLREPSLLTALGRGATPLGQWNRGTPASQAAARPGREVEDGAEDARSADTIVARRVRGEVELGQWNEGDLASVRQRRPGLEVEQAGATRRSMSTLSARIARGEQPLEAPEGRALVRPDGQGTAA